MKFVEKKPAERYREKIIPPAVCAAVPAGFDPGKAGPTNLEDLCLRLSIRSDDTKTALHWLIDSKFMKRSMRLPGFRYYPRKREEQSPLFGDEEMAKA